MIVGKKYKILGKDDSYLKDKPNGTIVECLVDGNNGMYEIKLIYKCKRKLSKNIGGWVIFGIKYDYEEIKYYNK